MKVLNVNRDLLFFIYNKYNKASPELTRRFRA